MAIFKSGGSTSSRPHLVEGVYAHVIHDASPLCVPGLCHTQAQVIGYLAASALKEVSAAGPVCWSVSQLMLCKTMVMTVDKMASH